MITRVKIDGYKSFRDFELEMKPLMVIFGPNTSGKSNLLDALQLASLIASEKNVKAAFEKHRGLPAESLSMIQRTEEPSTQLMTFQIDTQLGDMVCEEVEKKISELRKGLDQKSSATKPIKITEKNLRYSFSLEVTTPSSFTRIVDERLCALTKKAPHRERARSAFIEKVQDKIRVRMEGGTHPSYKDFGLDYSLVSSDLYAPHHPHVKAFKEEAERWRFYYFEPKKLMRTDTPIKTVEYIGPQGEELAGFFYTLSNKDLKSYESAKKSLRMLIPGIEGFDVELDEGKVKLLINESHGPLPSNLISEGTLKIIGLIAIFHSLKPPTVIGYEEPENGVHPDRLKLIADLFKNMVRYSHTQVIINTHSPEFVEHFEDSALFVSKKEKGWTRIEPLGATKPIYRRQLIRQSLADTR